MSETNDNRADAIAKLTEVDLAVAVLIAGGVQTRSEVMARTSLAGQPLTRSLRRLYRAGMLQGKNPAKTVDIITGLVKVRPRLCLSIEGYRWVAPARAARRA